jgi:diacylglycerol kinase (ATP)
LLKKGSYMHKNESENSAAALRGKQGMARIIAAADNSMNGFRTAWLNEAAFRQECVLLCCFVPAAFWLGQTATQVALLLMSCFVVLIVELLNTAVELVVDRISMERHELSGRAKDVASAAVLLGLTQLLVVWGLTAWQRFA